MDETRRNFIKGMFAGGTLLASGIPAITRAALAGSFFKTTRHCRLLLGNTAVAESFIKGAQSAYFGCGRHHDALPVFQLESGRSASFLHLTDLLMQSRNTRWIAVMDHADAALFTELVRDSAGHLLASGAHTFVSGDRVTLPLRHVWATASPVYSAGGLLAPMLAQGQYNFSIIERFLTQTEGENTVNDAAFPEFLSCRLTDRPATRLYYGGVPLPEAGQLIGWETSEDREVLLSRTATSLAGQNETAESITIEYPQPGNWAEATGYAIAAAALGVRINQESCSGRAFVYRSDQQYRDREVLSGVHFVSFVIDV